MKMMSCRFVLSGMTDDGLDFLVGHLLRQINGQDINLDLFLFSQVLSPQRRCTEPRNRAVA